MGIKDINKTLKDKVPDAYMTIPLSRLSGHAVGIDASLWMFKAKSSAMKDVLRFMSDPLDKMDEQTLIDSMVHQFYGLIGKICGSGVTPVWIFDGETHPAKIATDRRKKVKATKKVDIEEERQRLLSLDPLTRGPEMEKFRKNLLSCFCFTKKEQYSIKEEIEKLGLPMFTAPYDAEIFGSALSKRNLLIGMWTTDTDTYAAGSLLTITGFSQEKSPEGPQVELFCTAYALDHFGITLDEFADFCILHECDFNQRIPGFGPSGILKAMNANEWNLDRIMESDSSKDWTIANISECREIFAGPDVSNIKIEDLRIDKSKWFSHMKGKAFVIEIPDDPRLVEVVE